MPAKTTDLTNAIFEFIKANPGVTVKEISEQLDKPCRGVKVAVSNLAAKEKIESDFTKRGVPARYTAAYQAPQMATPVNGPGHTMKPLGKLTEPTSIPLRNSTKTGDYLGEWLERNPGIPPERFEAYELPSLVNGVRVAPKSITAMCVGVVTGPVGGGQAKHFQ